jgi:integral membrane protein
MQMNLIRRFRMTALAEGSSFLLLLFVAMPMKYVMGMPRVVTVVGAIHGILFLAYVAQLALLRTKHQWDNQFSFLAFLASLLPFGPFVFDKYLCEKETATS